MRRKKHRGSHENHERWLLTYADMITLLVAFFIMLYAMSITSKQKFDQLAMSVRSGFNGNDKLQITPLTPGLGIASSNALLSTTRSSSQTAPAKDSSVLTSAAGAAREEESLAALVRKIKAVAREHGAQNNLQVTEDERGVIVRILTDKILFRQGDGRLQSASNWLLDSIADAIHLLPNDVAIEGHTDNVPIHTAAYPSNWELSTSRATNVLRYLIERDHIRPTQVCAAGYADTRPIASNTDDTGRAHNRRVDIVVLRRYPASSDADPSADAHLPKNNPLGIAL